MSNQQIQYLSDYVYLAEASYADFSGISYLDIELVKKRIRDAGGDDKKPANFAKLVTNNYNVIAHYKDRQNARFWGGVESSFSGTLFQNKSKVGWVEARNPSLDI
jgi:hypothetical protein